MLHALNKQNNTTHDPFFISNSAMLKKFRSTSKDDVDQFLNKKNSDLYLRKLQISFDWRKI